MALIKKINKRRESRALRVRNTLGTNERHPRVSVFRSLKQIYAQVIDDKKGVTLTSCSSLELAAKGDKKEVAKEVGLELAKRAHERGVEKVRFDRGRFAYHGRVQALAEGLREGGLKI